jgi:uncharacterized membrane protein HdeD (DUF308 family)
MRSELDETHGATRLRWLLGMAWVGALGLVTPIVAAGVVFGVVGATFGTHEVFLEVYRGGSSSWIGALALTLPTALVGLAAALLVLRRHRAALAAAYGFAVLVAASSVISITNVTPVRPFLDDWQRVTTDPRAADHSDELRINSAIGAIAEAAALLAVARQRRPRTRTHPSPTA